VADGTLHDAVKLVHYLWWPPEEGPVKATRQLTLLVLRAPSAPTVGNIWYSLAHNTNVDRQQATATMPAPRECSCGPQLEGGGQELRGVRMRCRLLEQAPATHTFEE
jgi:hypothetical protein